MRWRASARLTEGTAVTRFLCMEPNDRYKRDSGGLMALLTSMRVQGYRLFRSLAVEGLTRVNVFVGKNNAGKTALLEAVSILAAADFPYAIYRSSLERNEEIVEPPPESGRYQLRFEPRNWFSEWQFWDARLRIEGE